MPASTTTPSAVAATVATRVPSPPRTNASRDGVPADRDRAPAVLAHVDGGSRDLRDGQEVLARGPARRPRSTRRGGPSRRRMPCSSSCPWPRHSCCRRPCARPRSRPRARWPRSGPGRGAAWWTGRPASTGRRPCRIERLRVRSRRLPVRAVQRRQAVGRDVHDRIERSVELGCRAPRRARPPCPAPAPRASDRPRRHSSGTRTGLRSRRSVARAPRRRRRGSAMASALGSTS